MAVKATLKKYAKRYFIDAMGAMALGLFASLLIGTILSALGMIPGLSILTKIGTYAQKVSGAVMGIAIAYALGAHPLVLFSSAAVGFAAHEMGKAGGPIAVFLAPLLGTAVGYISTFIGWASLQAPLVSALVISVVIGMCLTLPISSAAICAGLVLTGSAAAVGSSEGLAIAGAAAVAGCCTQMIGFAVISFRENGFGGLLSQGIGTSMLQMPNIIKNPRIWLAPTLASAITGPLGVCVFHLRMYGVAIESGMGTCGLLGPIGMILGWLDASNGYPGTVGVLEWVGLALVCFVLPAVLSLLFDFFFRKLGWVKDGDMLLPQS